MEQFVSQIETFVLTEQYHLGRVWSSDDNGMDCVPLKKSLFQSTVNPESETGQWTEFFLQTDELT
jgi:hypothetical protein